METKLKIILVIFILVIIGYGIYFIVSDFDKQKSSYNNDKHIIEKFEDYDIRKQVLNELDSYSIDNKTKTSVYDKLVLNIEKLKDMSKDSLDLHIKDVVNSMKKTAGSKSQSKETFQEDSDMSEPSKITESGQVASTESFRDTMSDTKADKKTDVKGDAKADAKAKSDPDVLNMLDKTVTDLKQIKTMVAEMSKRSPTANSGSLYDSPGIKLDMKKNMDNDFKLGSNKTDTKADKKDKPSKVSSRDNDSDDDEDDDDMIEGFENSVSKQYAFI